MVIDRRKTLLFGSASALRILLFFGFPSLPDLLTGRVEISTPVTSFKRCMLEYSESCAQSYILILAYIMKYKKDSFSTHTTSRHMMEGSSIRQAHISFAIEKRNLICSHRHRCSCLYSRSFLLRHFLF